MKNIPRFSEKYCFFILLCFASLTLCKNADAAAPIANSKIIQTVLRDSIKQADYLIQIMAAPNGTYGYDIYKGEKLFIHQPTIPAMPGNSGFATKSDAEKVTRLVADKMKKVETLPTITVDELKHLGVIPKQ